MEPSASIDEPQKVEILKDEEAVSVIVEPPTLRVVEEGEIAEPAVVVAEHPAEPAQPEDHAEAPTADPEPIPPVPCDACANHVCPPLPEPHVCPPCEKCATHVCPPCNVCNVTQIQKPCYQCGEECQLVVLHVPSWVPMEAAPKFRNDIVSAAEKLRLSRLMNAIAQSTPEQRTLFERFYGLGK